MFFSGNINLPMCYSFHKKEHVSTKKNILVHFMNFPERLTRIRKEKNLSVPDLARLSSIHAVQLRRYEKGESQPTLDALRKLAIALNIPGDVLLFDDQERQPPENFLLQFNALNQLSPEDQKSIRTLIDGLLMRHQAKMLIND
jgi:transcriptional regulator with XRE-family HTH domain